MMYYTCLRSKLSPLWFQKAGKKKNGIFFRKYGNIGIEIRLTGEYMVFKSFFLKGESFIGKGG